MRGGYYTWIVTDDRKPGPPSASDGPQKPVDWRELEEDAHPVQPKESQDVDAEQR